MPISSVGHQRSLRFACFSLVTLAAGLVACVSDDPFFPHVTPEDETGSGGSNGAPGNAGTSGSSAGSGPSPIAPVGTAGTTSNVGNGSGGAAPMADAGPMLIDAAPPCDPCPCSVGPFGAPELVSVFAGPVLAGSVLGGPDREVPGDLFGPAFSADSLELFFSSVAGDENILSATRTDRGAAFGAAAVVPNLDGGGTDEGTPFLTFDGLSLYFFSTRPGPGTVGNRDLWLSTRATPKAQFTAPFVVPAVNGVDLDHLPRLSRDELTLLFVSGRDSPNAASNIWVAERPNESAEFGPARELEGINTNAREEGFSLAADGRTLFFASDRVIALDMDIWVATRATASGAFEAPESLEALNTTFQELDPALSPDGFELFFASDRSGSMQLYRSLRVCEP